MPHTLEPSVTVMRVRPEGAPPPGNLYQEVRNHTRWVVPLGFLVLVIGRILLAQN